MEKEMQTLYIEGLATHGDPESCVGTREDDGEALAGAHAGRAIEPRNNYFGVPTMFLQTEGNTAGGAIREPCVDPARSENPSMYGISMRENREVPRLPVVPDQEMGRKGKAEVVIPR
jgi:hypothetical protein